MKNKFIDISFDKFAKAKSLKFCGEELLNNLTGEDRDPDKNNSFYCDYHIKGQTVNIHPTRVEVLSNTAEIVHIAYIDDVSKLGIEYHFILLANDSAIYSYVKAWNNSSQPLEINELRTVYRLNHQLFYTGYNGERLGLQPTSKQMLLGKKIQDETYRMIDGSLYTNSSIYSKYDYAGSFRNTNLWGQFGSHLGFWFIPVNTSYYGSGPENQDLMVHYDGIVLNYLSSEHFGKGKFTIPIKWRKFYGPWCIYLNRGSLEDAQYRAYEEKNKWPYHWVKDSDYPLNLGKLAGCIVSEYTSKNYRLVLADSSLNKKIIHQHGGYTYYADSDENGEFRISNIRPGKYMFYAYGVDSEDLEVHALGEVHVKPDKNINLGQLYIKKNYYTLWQIGTASHTTDGFKFSNQLRNYTWLGLVPNNLSYRIGHNDDWYYLQNDQGEWKIIFEANRSYIGDIHLQISLAGATQKVMTDAGGENATVKLNGQLIATCNFDNDRAAYRSAMKSGENHFWDIKISAELFYKLHKNTISITTDGYLMYDAIKLCIKKGE